MKIIIHLFFNVCEPFITPKILDSLNSHICLLSSSSSTTGLEVWLHVLQSGHWLLRFEQTPRTNINCSHMWCCSSRVSECAQETNLLVKGQIAVHHLTASADTLMQASSSGGSDSALPPGWPGGATGGGWVKTSYASFCLIISAVISGVTAKKRIEFLKLYLSAFSQLQSCRLRACRSQRLTPPLLFQKLRGQEFCLEKGRRYFINRLAKEHRTSCQSGEEE